MSLEQVPKTVKIHLIPNQERIQDRKAVDLDLHGVSLACEGSIIHATGVRRHKHIKIKVKPRKRFHNLTT
jgi:hypothetical protein